MIDSIICFLLDGICLALVAVYVFTWQDYHLPWVDRYYSSPEVARLALNDRLR